MNYRDATTILGLPEKWDDDMLKKAYRKRALRYHPDKNQSEDASFQFDLVKQAFEYLVASGSQKTDNRRSTNNTSNSFWSDDSSGDEDGAADITKLFDKLRPFNPDKLQRLFGACKEVVGITKDMMSELTKKSGKKETKYELEVELSKMLNDEVYMLKHNGTPLLVPLWFEDVYYDKVNADDDVVSVSIIPKLPSEVGVSIKDTNHLVVSVPYEKLEGFDAKLYQSPNANIVDVDMTKLWKGSKITLWNVGLLKVFENTPDKMNTKEREGVTFVVV